jgi:hypothetical protein
MSTTIRMHTKKVVIPLTQTIFMEEVNGEIVFCAIENLPDIVPLVDVEAAGVCFFSHPLPAPVKQIRSSPLPAPVKAIKTIKK